MLPKTHCFVSNSILNVFPTLITSQKNGVQTTVIPQRKQCMAQTPMCLVVAACRRAGCPSIPLAGLEILCRTGCPWSPSASWSAAPHPAQTMFLVVTSCCLFGDLK